MNNEKMHNVFLNRKRSHSIKEDKSSNIPHSSSLPFNKSSNFIIPNNDERNLQLKETDKNLTEQEERKRYPEILKKNKPENHQNQNRSLNLNNIGYIPNFNNDSTQNNHKQAICDNNRNSIQKNNTTFNNFRNNNSDKYSHQAKIPDTTSTCFQKLDKNIYQKNLRNSNLDRNKNFYNASSYSNNDKMKKGNSFGYYNKNINNKNEIFKQNNTGVDKESIEIENMRIREKINIFIHKIEASYSSLGNLPIMNEKERILHLLETQQVIIISGTTGCGKTTQVPKFIFEYLLQKNNEVLFKENKKILITQPRRIAAVSIARRLSEELDEPLGGLVGFHVGLNPFYGIKTKIIVCTTGIFLQKIINENHIDEFGYIIIDEVHERDCDIDLLLIMIKHLLKRNSQVKLILMSATISTTLFSHYFSQTSIREVDSTDYYSLLHKNKKENFITSTDIWNNPMRRDLDFLDQVANIRKQQVEISNDSAKIIEIKMKIFQITCYYLDLILLNLKNKYGSNRLFPFLNYQFNFQRNDAKIERDLYKITFLIILSIMNKDLGKDENNSILIFLPGINEIQELEKTIISCFEEYDNSLLNQIIIFQLHSGISDDEQQEIFKKTFKRKIIISTNIAESSITIPDTKYVIDFCLVKELNYSMHTGAESLELCWSSKSSCDQRMGRAGRVSDGFCFRLVRKQFYEKDMSTDSCAEILRIPLEKTILRLKVWNQGEPIDILGRTIEPPLIKMVNHAIRNLQAYGALSVNSEISESGELTELGRIYSVLPIEIKYSRLIILGYAFNLIEPAIIIAALLSNEKSIFKVKNPVALYDMKNYLSAGCDCDFLIAYKAFFQWFKIFKYDYNFDQKNLKNSTAKDFIKREKAICHNLNLNYNVAKETKTLCYDIIKRLKKLGYFTEKDSFFSNEILELKDDDDIFFMKIIFSGAFYGKIMKASYTNPLQIKKRLESLEIIKKKFNFTDFPASSEIQKLTENEQFLSECVFLKNVEPDNDMNDEIQNMLCERIFKFKAKFQILLYNEEFIIRFQEPEKGMNWELIKKLLNMSSNSRFKEKIFFLELEDLRHQCFTINLPKPEYCYEVRLRDIFTVSAIDNELNSFNHMIIEANRKKMDKMFYISDNYYTRNNKILTRNSCKLPEYAMIDKLIILIFTPSAEFFSNKDSKGYGYFNAFGSELNLNFTHSFSSHDIKEINKIRGLINKLVTPNLFETNYLNLSNKLRKELKELIVKKERFKLVTNEDFWRMFSYYFPEQKSIRDTYFKKPDFSETYNNQIREEDEELKNDIYEIQKEEHEDGYVFDDENEESKKNSGNKFLHDDQEIGDEYEFDNQVKVKNENEMEIETLNESNINVINKYTEYEDQELVSRMKNQTKDEVENINIINHMNLNIQESDDYKLATYAAKRENNGNITIKKEFLCDLPMLDINEDKRLWSKNGVAELKFELEKFKQLPQLVFQDFNILKNLLLFDSPRIICKLCDRLICNLSNLVNFKGLHKLTGWIEPYIKEEGKDTMKFRNQFVNDIENFIEKNNDIEGYGNVIIDKYIGCSNTISHIFGIKTKGEEYFISNFSPIWIEFPCGKKISLTAELANNQFEQVRIENKESLKVREEKLHKKAYCSLCDVRLDIHPRTTIREIKEFYDKHFTKNKLHKELLNCLLEEDFE